VCAHGGGGRNENLARHGVFRWAPSGQKQWLTLNIEGILGMSCVENDLITMRSDRAHRYDRRPPRSPNRTAHRFGQFRSSDPVVTLEDEEIIRPSVEGMAGMNFVVQSYISAHHLSTRTDQASRAARLRLIRSIMVNTPGISKADCKIVIENVIPESRAYFDKDLRMVFLQ
jgi:hypothetical protein